MTQLWSQTQWPLWIWAMLFVCTIVVALLTTHGLALQQGRRRLIAITRLCVLSVLLVIMARLQWTQMDTFTTSDVVTVLVDRSDSMTVVEDGVERDAQLRYLVDRLAASPTLAHTVRWMGFARTSEALASSEGGPPVLPGVQGGPTRIDHAIEQALVHSAGRPRAGIVLLTDGRGSLDTASGALRSAGVGVWVLPVGSTKAPMQVELTQVQAPRVAFFDDPVNVRVTLETKPPASGTAMVRVINSDGAQTGESRSPLLDGRTVIDVPAHPTLPGLANWTVEVQVDGQQVGDRTLTVDMRDAPLRVLLIEGDPRVQHRFLVPMLEREQVVDLSVVMQRAHPDAAPDGNTPIRRLPETPEEFAAFDLIMIGDVDPRSLTDRQQAMIHDQVMAGAGLLWMPGPDVPHTAWQDSQLALLHPLDTRVGGSTLRGPVSLTTEGESLMLPTPPTVPLEWVIGATAVRPQARSLADVRKADGETTPLILLLPTGSGRVGWLGSDDMWRWRRTDTPRRGDELMLGLVRLLARQSDAAAPYLRVTPEPTVGRLSTIRLDGEEADTHVARQVLVTDSDGVSLQRIELHAQGHHWRGLWTPARAGRMQLACDDIRQTVQVHATDTENMNKSADIDALSALVNEAGGAIVQPEDIDRLMAMLPDRSTTTSHRTMLGPAFSWLLWGLLAGFLTLEWGLRRWNALA